MKLISQHPVLADLPHLPTLLLVVDEDRHPGTLVEFLPERQRVEFLHGRWLRSTLVVEEGSIVRQEILHHLPPG